jgi:tryptophan 2,3-dioxygenase
MPRAPAFVVRCADQDHGRAAVVTNRRAEVERAVHPAVNQQDVRSRLAVRLSERGRAVIADQFKRDVAADEFEETLAKQAIVAEYRNTDRCHRASTWGETLLET